MRSLAQALSSRTVLTGAALLGLCLSSGCDQASPIKKQAPDPNLQDAPVLVPLTAAFLARGLSALEGRLKPESEILELRVTGRSFSVQLRAPETFQSGGDARPIAAGSLIQIDYIEAPSEPGQPPVSRIFGPVAVATRGQGELKSNVFPLSEVDLPAMARAFSTAEKAIDPADGKVEELVVRRFLPVSERVRGRIFVHSPRMRGSIDVNDRGTPLKR